MLNSTRKFITIGVCFSTGHLILTFLSIVIPFVLGAPRFDNPDLPVSTLEEVASFPLLHSYPTDVVFSS
jgi:hypothetical protein